MAQLNFVKETFSLRRRDLSPSEFRISARFYAVALLLVPLNILWVLYSEVVRYAGHPTTISLFYNVVFWLCVLTAVNALLRRTTPKLALTRGDLIALYVVLGLSSGLAGHDTIEVLLPLLTYPARNADATNSWNDSLLPHLPPWLVMRDKTAVDHFYIGHAELWQSGEWQAWIAPIMVWSCFLGTLCWVMLCGNVILRRQWTEREKLAFPLVYLPLELTQPSAPVLKQSLLWWGFGLAAALQIYNGIAFLYPSLPMLPIKYTDYGSLFSARPWNAIGWFPVGFYPFAIALGALLPLDLSFSAWFFYWFWKGQAVSSSAFGWDRTPGFPHIAQQSFGAYAGLAVSALWGARRVIGKAFAALLDFRTVPDEDEDAPLPMRFAALGVVVGVVALAVFCRLLGMSWIIITLFFTGYFAIAITITRMRAELGAPVHDLHQGAPNLLLPQTIGASNMASGDLSAFALFYGFNRAYRGHPSPIQMEGFKMSEQGAVNGRSLFGIMAATGFIAPFLAFVILIAIGYDRGAAGNIGPPNVLGIFGREGWDYWNSWARTPRPPQHDVTAMIGFGFLLSLGLQVARLRVAAFPFHPVGYAIASSWGMSVVWMPMFLAYVLKATTLKYGGLAAYRRIVPLLWGIILGECVVGSLWGLLSLATGIPMYGFWP